ncbi:membrane protein [Klebsiella pneumoniae subsp. pneumoniae]|nr:membrane protein [Klebsiella pneumoniae subsp. pneumoniae]
MAWLLSLFSHSALMRILLPALLAVACYGWGFRRQRRETQWHYSTEAILFLGVVLPPWRYGSLANGWITAAAISHRCFWPDA